MKIKNLENIDVIFISCYDHNEGTNNHGLFQMFEFFQKNLDRKSIYLSTLQGIYVNDKDVFDISSLGEHIPLASQVNSTFMSFAKDNPHMWLNKFAGDREAYTEYASKILIDNLPAHKFIAISDKVDVDLFVLEKVLRHFNSKVVILSAASNTWTGYCSYPDEFNCDKFKTKEGCCHPCPALKSKSEIVARNTVDNDFLIKSFNDTKSFVERNKNSVLLNVGSTYSMEEANESSIFKDVEKVLITLKTIYPPENFEDIWEHKKQQRKQLFDKLRQNNFKHEAINSVDDIKFVMMWSAHDIILKRKGIDYFINSLQILKYFLKFNRFGEVLLIVSSKLSDKEAVKTLKNLNIPVAFTGHVDRDVYNFLLSASDVYCSTTLSDAGPRTIIESAAAATPIISFDKCVASDIVNENNGALIETYDVKKFAEELFKFANLTESEKKQYSKNLYDDYKTVMDSQALANKWEDFFKKYEVR